MAVNVPVPGAKLSDKELAKSDFKRTKYKYEPDTNTIDSMFREFTQITGKQLIVTGGDRSDNFVAKAKAVAKKTGKPVEGLSNHVGRKAADLGVASNKWLKGPGSEKYLKLFMELAVKYNLRVGDVINGGTPHLHFDTNTYKKKQIFLEGDYKASGATKYYKEFIKQRDDNEAALAADPNFKAPAPDRSDFPDYKSPLTSALLDTVEPQDVSEVAELEAEKQLIASSESALQGIEESNDNTITSAEPSEVQQPLESIS